MMRLYKDAVSSGKITGFLVLSVYVCVCMCVCVRIVCLYV